MKRIIGLITGATLLASLTTFGADAPKPLTTDKEKASYGIGVNVGKRFKNDSLELDLDAFMRGIKDTLTDAKQALTDEEINKALEGLRDQVQQKAAAAGEKNKKAGDEFLAKNKQEKGVTTLPDGLQYKVLKEGTGPMPKETDTVRVNYRGTLIDGTEFDSSYKRGEPVEFPVNGVIKGWVEALQKMKVGSKWQLCIPPDLAYGANGSGPIPPNSTLIFEVELLGIVNK
jgi:FKBP-type peptidyl-prolyl cis-trans isomerase